MNVTTTPVSGRLRFTYLAGRPDMRISGTSPNASASGVNSFLVALAAVQDGTVDHVISTVESDLASV